MTAARADAPNCETIPARPSRLAAELLEAYRATHYLIHDGTHTVRACVGRHEPSVSCLLHRHRVPCAAFLTACNPNSRPQSRWVNLRLEHRLERLLLRRGIRYLRGIGHPADGASGWRGEPSVLALGVARRDANDLARQFRQNAWVLLHPARPAELVLLR